jgi:hypothetical protein
MMHKSSYQVLLNRGRKAGLNARELNQALATRPVAGDEAGPGQADPNGYVASIDARGHRTYRPANSEGRS